MNGVRDSIVKGFTQELSLSLYTLNDVSSHDLSVFDSDLILPKSRSRYKVTCL